MAMYIFNNFLVLYGWDSFCCIGKTNCSMLLLHIDGLLFVEVKIFYFWLHFIIANPFNYNGFDNTGNKMLLVIIDLCKLSGGLENHMCVLEF